MFANRIRISNFRNIQEADISFEKGVNIFFGNNAMGKTNALEAVYLFANGKSFRTPGDKELIKTDFEFAKVKLDFETSLRKYDSEIRLVRDKRKVCLRNGVAVKKLSDFIGCFRAVLFCPEHLSIIKEGPGERRTFLDMAISQLHPLYLASLQKYNNILLQRNMLLKNYAEQRELFDRTIETWSACLAREAALISEERENYIKKLDDHVCGFFKDMTGGFEKTELLYSQRRTESEYLFDLTKNIDKEISAGTTLYGVHKDDMQIFLNGKASRLYCSQGQQRCLALALKMAEGEISKEETGEYPVFLFDDVFSELDSKRKDYVISGIKEKQVIITSCEKTGLESTASSVIEVSNGIYKKV